MADAERKLAVKPTKTASEEKRKATNNIERYLRWIEDAKRTTPKPKTDDRIYPDWYCLGAGGRERPVRDQTNAIPLPSILDAGIVGSDARRQEQREVQRTPRQPGSDSGAAYLG